MGFRYIVSVADLYDERWNEENIEILKKQILKVSNIKKKPTSGDFTDGSRFIQQKKREIVSEVLPTTQ